MTSNSSCFLKQPGKLFRIINITVNVTAILFTKHWCFKVTPDLFKKFCNSEAVIRAGSVSAVNVGYAQLLPAFVGARKFNIIQETEAIRIN